MTSSQCKIPKSISQFDYLLETWQMTSQNLNKWATVDY